MWVWEHSQSKQSSCNEQNVNESRPLYHVCTLRTYKINILTIEQILAHNYTTKTTAESGVKKLGKKRHHLNGVNITPDMVLKQHLFLVLH